MHDLLLGMLGDKDAQRRVVEASARELEGILLDPARRWRTANPDEPARVGPETGRAIAVVMAEPGVAEGLIRSMIIKMLSMEEAHAVELDAALREAARQKLRADRNDALVSDAHAELRLRTDELRHRTNTAEVFADRLAESEERRRRAEEQRDAARSQVRAGEQR